MRDVPRTACLLNRAAAEVAAERAREVGIGRAAVQAGVSRNTLRSAWRRYGIEVTPPGGGGRRRRPADSSRGP
jgi:hypothetical protein